LFRHKRFSGSPSKEAELHSKSEVSALHEKINIVKVDEVTEREALSLEFSKQNNVRRLKLATLFDSKKVALVSVVPKRPNINECG